MSDQDQAEELSGVEQAAVLLMSIGEEDAASVMKHMGPKELQRLGAAMASLQNVSQNQVTVILDQFLEAVGSHTALGVDSESYIRDVMVKALGEDKAGGLMDRILLGGSAQGLETLKWMDSRSIADMIRNEHPQIISIVLAYLDSDQSAEVLAILPERTRPDLLLRVATLDAIQPAALQELNQILETQVSGTASMQAATVGGTKTAANIMNFTDSSIETEIMEQIKEADAELGQKIEDLMFVFENLSEVDDSGTQAILREVSSDVLLLALKGSDEEMREKFFRNMSKRAAEMLRDDLEAKGPVKLSEVEGAQKEVLAIARRMADEG
ncbi:MAG: flagellar motor switch protein FliG, partial [Gammaproteobacteria bacterium]|nr:flagellar motor switch protein FliG [Gammaproteobacteria bacterium]